MSLFTVVDGDIWMLSHARPTRLSERLVDGLLDLFEEAGATEPFNELYEASFQAGGVARRSCLIAANAGVAP